MKLSRQRYYDYFSRFYDKFISIHSADKGENARVFLSENVGLQRGGMTLDICAGTGSLLPHLGNMVKKEGIVAGVDFSFGMLSAGRSKIVGYKNIFLIQADVSYLPFKGGIFDSVTCSHAFYELKGETQDYCLREIVRVLKHGKPFFMMEHDVPKNFLIRMLFYLRLLSMGVKKAKEILKNEKTFLKKYFNSVEIVITPNTRSKILICKG
ncbi:MAG: class I SAM-dependent methyltransferase [Thermodesulfobacteriota bacterium]|nr:class I SAM-dependent methyltransferase [Thermodesulfobacteriota bacterium]